MLRQGITSVFILAFLIAVTLFLLRDTTSLKTKFEQESRDLPRLMLHGLSVYKYRNSSINWRAFADQGAFYSPNLMEFIGKVSFFRKTEGRTTSVRTHIAQAYFVGEKLSSILLNPNIKTILLKKNVVILDGVEKLSTELLRYQTALNLVSSPLPVKVETNNYTMTSLRGIKFNTQEEKLRLFGKISGVVDEK